jgi:hypothetical protein
LHNSKTPSRASRAEALRSSPDVPHQATIRPSSASSRRPCAVPDWAQQRGTTALLSQNALNHCLDRD